MAFTRFGPKDSKNGTVVDANPMTLHYLGRFISFLEVLSASDEMPAPLKAAADKLVQEARHHIQTTIAPTE